MARDRRCGHRWSPARDSGPRPPPRGQPGSQLLALDLERHPCAQRDAGARWEAQQGQGWEERRGWGAQGCTAHRGLISSRGSTARPAPGPRPGSRAGRIGHHMTSCPRSWERTRSLVQASLGRPDPLPTRSTSGSTQRHASGSRLCCAASSACNLLTGGPPAP
jgi:hypothetical protein